MSDINHDKTGQLKGVSKTLLIPLLSRSSSTYRVDQFEDLYAKEIVKNLNISIKEVQIDYFLKKSCISRTKIIDSKIKNIQDQNNMSMVVTLGAGLCTRYLRLNQYVNHFIDIDFKKVNQLKKELLPENAKMKLFNADIINDNWQKIIKEQQHSKIIKEQQHSKIIFILEGVSMYLEKQDFQDLVLKLIENFNDSHLIFDFVHPLLSKNTFLVNAVNKMNVQFKNGLLSTKQFHQTLKKKNKKNLFQYQRDIAIGSDYYSKVLGLEINKLIPSSFYPYSIGHIYW